MPLQAWLLDAMEGPTPVSALIHAATMVTAGVYLVVRSHAIFESRPDRQHRGGRSSAPSRCWWAPGSAPAKDDIKKVLAGSTMSQIGYMMLAAGHRPGRLRLRDLPPAHPRRSSRPTCSSAPARSCTP